MKLKKAIQILESHQEWRLGNIDEMPHTPKEITEALNLVLKEVKKNNKPWKTK